jgi:DNA-binding IclR family transcriptional regulator
VKEDRQFVTALARGLEVLRCFTPERSELSGSQIAALTGLPQPTVWRLCHTLAKLGYLVPDKATDRLRVGPAVLALGSASITHSGVAEFAYPLMKEIADEFEASVSLAIRDRTSMVIIQRAEARTILKLSLHVGSALDIDRSALGWAYAVGIGQDAREALLSEVRRATPDRLPQYMRDIDAALEQYRKFGLVFNLRRYHPDVNAIGVPVIAANGQRVLALNCGGASSIVTKTKLTGPIGAAMKSLAAKLAPVLAAERGGATPSQRS